MKFVGVLALFCLVAVCQGRYMHPDEKTALALLARQFNPRIQTGLQLKFYERQVKANMNDYVDRMLKNAAQYMLDNGLDPMQLPDVTKPFSFKDLIGIEWHGELDLKHGWLQDLSTIYRSGDVTVEDQNGKLLIKAVLAFKDLVFDYDFTAKFMQLSKNGEIDGKATGVMVSFSALVDMDAKTIELQDFTITHVSNTDVKFEGLGTVGDFVVDALSKVVVDFFKKDVLEAVQAEVRKAIEDALSHTNIGDLVNDIARL